MAYLRLRFFSGFRGCCRSTKRLLERTWNLNIKIHAGWVEISGPHGCNILKFFITSLFLDSRAFFTNHDYKLDKNLTEILDESRQKTKEQIRLLIEGTRIFETLESFLDRFLPPHFVAPWSNNGFFSNAAIFDDAKGVGQCRHSGGWVEPSEFNDFNVGPEDWTSLKPIGVVWTRVDKRKQRKGFFWTEICGLRVESSLSQRWLIWSHYDSQPYHCSTAFFDCQGKETRMRMAWLRQSIYTPFVQDFRAPSTVVLVQCSGCMEEN